MIDTRDKGATGEMLEAEIRYHETLACLVLIRTNNDFCDASMCFMASWPLRLA